MLMRRIILALILPLVAACDFELIEFNEPDGPDQPDTTYNSGTLLTRESVYETGHLVWVPGSELVAFFSWPECAVKTVDVASGSTTVIDGDCVSPGGSGGSRHYLRSLVVASDGSALYYTVGIGDPRNPEWVLRVADPFNGGVTTLRSGVGAALALSPDGQQLAYVSLDDSTHQWDSLIVRDLLSGAETHYGTGNGLPILFSPDGTELLYEVRGAYPLTVRRLSLGDGTSDPVSLPGINRVRLFHWDASGLKVLIEQGRREYYVRNLGTGESIQVGAGEHLQFWGATWSTDGTCIAYWIYSCLELAGLDYCKEPRLSLFVAGVRSGTWVRLARVKDSGGPTVFSPDGTRIVYSLGGKLYVSDVP